VADTDVVLADARDLDPAERDTLTASQVRRVPANPAAITQIEECLAAVCAIADVRAACIACAWLPDHISDQTTRETITRLARALGTNLAWHEPAGH
jgi:arginase